MPSDQSNIDLSHQRDPLASFGEDSITRHDGSADGPMDTAAVFASQHNLSDKTDVLRRALQSLEDGSTATTVPCITPDELLALEKEETHKWTQPWTLYLVITATALGAMGQGWAQTSMNGANLGFPSALKLRIGTRRDDIIIGLINSGIYVSNGMLGSWLVAPLNARFGRRWAVFGAAAVSFVGNAAGALAQNWVQLLVCRALLGCALGVISSTLNILLAESVPAPIRGGLAVSWQLFCAFGIFVGFVTNAALYHLGPDSWRWQLAAPALSTLPLLVVILSCPESPAWYVKHNTRYDLAFKSLCRLRNTELQAARDLLRMYLQKATLCEKTAHWQIFIDLFTIPRVRRATLAAHAVMICQQLCGINIIAFYSSTIFVEANFSNFGALLASVAFGFVNFTGAFPAIWTMDSFGRRSLLLLTLPMMALTMLAAAFSFLLPQSSPARFILLASMIYLFCAEYSPGMGPVPAAYSAEVFPLSHRELGASSAVAMANIWATALSITFPSLLSGLGPQGVFTLYGVLNLVAFALVFLFVRETKKSTLEELDATFSLSTSAFIRFQALDYLPWLVQRYLLRQSKTEPPQLLSRTEYHALEQEDDET